MHYSAPRAGSLTETEPDPQPQVFSLAVNVCVCVSVHADEWIHLCVLPTGVQSQEELLLTVCHRVGPAE